MYARSSSFLHRLRWTWFICIAGDLLQFALLFCMALVGLEPTEITVSLCSREIGSKACIATTPYHTTPPHSGFYFFLLFKNWVLEIKFRPLCLCGKRYQLSYFLLHPVFFIDLIYLLFGINLWIRFYITVLFLWLKRTRPRDSLDKVARGSVVSSWALVWTQSLKRYHCAVSEKSNPA